MKKKEIGIIVGIVLIAVVALFGMQILQKGKTTDEAPTTQAKGTWVAIIHRSKVQQWFDSGVDDEYTIEGNYGKMVIEVKDKKWHVKEVECPNHTCQQMGWDDGTNIVPITCIPNDIMICTQEFAENYLADES